MSTKPTELSVPRSAVARQDVPPAPAKLSSLLIPEDYKPSDEKYWTLYALTNAVRDTDRVFSKEFEIEIKKVIEDADIRDLSILTRAIRHWYEFNGEDRVQAGTLIASILYESGIREIEPGGAEKTRIEVSARYAKDRLTSAGVPFVDDTKEAS